MERLLELTFILGIAALLVWAAIMFVKAVKEPAKVKVAVNADLDDLIENLKAQIAQAELLAESGIEEATQKLTDLKARLEKAKQIKNKL